MISCRVSRREYKVQQGRLPVHRSAAQPLLRLHFQVVFAGRARPRREWARGRRGAQGEWHLPVESTEAARLVRLVTRMAEGRSGEINHAPPNTTDDGATGGDM
jgi:hypothetical protein